MSSSEDELEWEEWDGTSPFWHHCVAGSVAGVAEHTLVYPFDTVKTHLQACANCPRTTTPAGTMPSATAHKLSPARMTGMWTTMRHIVSQASYSAPTAEVSSTAAGMTRLWRGVYTMAVGCIPAHALYFSTYEAVKHAFLDESGQLSAPAGMAAGGAAAVSHDVVMAPLDTVKQRLQLGHYQGMNHALSNILRFEGTSGLFRSFPITLLTNIPYGMVMVSTNEVLKQKLSDPEKPLSVQTCLVASSIAGMAAAATTTPLDRVKTFLQTQQLQPACPVTAGQCPKLTPSVKTPSKALQLILKREGARGLFKGMVPRVITHTPAVAISWTTYETAKQWLASHYL